MAVQDTPEINKLNRKFSVFLMHHPVCPENWSDICGPLANICTMPIVSEEGAAKAAAKGETAKGTAGIEEAENEDSDDDKEDDQGVAEGAAATGMNYAMILNCDWRFWD